MIITFLARGPKYGMENPIISNLKKSLQGRVTGQVPIVYLLANPVGTSLRLR
jgi:hypothetical protein